jgi:flagellar biosynthetic protein FliQ
MMDPAGTMLDLIRTALVLAATVLMPVLLVAGGVGVFVGLVQAATNTQDQSVSHTPKVIAVVAAVIVLLPWATQRIAEFAGEVWRLAP